MENKTAMQILLDDVKIEYESSKRIRLAWLLQRINNLMLFEEKQQITDAYCEPYNYENHLPDDLLDSAEQYYNEMYGKGN